MHRLKYSHTHTFTHIHKHAATRGGTPARFHRDRAYRENQISDAGVAALASALRGGALPSCNIYLSGNPGSEAPDVDEALASPERAAALALRQAE